MTMFETNKVYSGDHTDPDDNVIWSMVAFCRTCGEVATKADSITPSMKPIVEKVTPKYAMCDDSDHNDFEDCNFNYDALWFRDWKREL